LCFAEIRLNVLTICNKKLHFQYTIWVESVPQLATCWPGETFDDAIGTCSPKQHLEACRQPNAALYQFAPISQQPAMKAQCPGMLRFQLISLTICNERNLLFKPIEVVV
jgi:hypothetical protein